ncbi:MAG: glucose 1-dehydrogenase [Betaproteobacteria bacterium]|nr:glucose 1-dehydrogenase [Betaproteobacteria bacterium]
MKGLGGKITIVTGAGSGIGKAIARRLAAEGCVVGVLDRNASAADETTSDIRRAGGKAYGYTVDITDLAAIQTAVRAFEADAGPIDALVNNAGWDKAAPFLASTPELWKQLIDINLYGPINMHHAVLPGMVARKRGRVINIASDAGRVGSSGESVYSACKGGIIAFTKTLAREHARHNIQLNAVCPGPTDTPLLRSFADEGEAGAKLIDGLTRAIPMRRLGQPDDYPGIVAFLASDDAAFITGQTISVSGGLTMHG